MQGGQAKTGRAAGNDSGREQEGYDRKRVDGVACQDQENIADKL